MNIKQSLDKLILPLYMMAVLTYSGIWIGQGVNDYVHRVGKANDSQTGFQYIALDNDGDNQIDEITRTAYGTCGRAVMPPMTFRYGEETEGFKYLKNKFFSD